MSKWEDAIVAAAREYKSWQEEFKRVCDKEGHPKTTASDKKRLEKEVLETGKQLRVSREALFKSIEMLDKFEKEVVAKTKTKLGVSEPEPVETEP